MRAWSMGLAALGCLFGAAGVALAAAAAHRPESALATTGAYFLLFHAAAITGFGAIVPRDRFVNVAATLLAVGVILFSGELALHALAGLRPLPMAAPTGGMLMILGWLAAAIALPRALGRSA